MIGNGINRFELGDNNVNSVEFDNGNSGASITIDFNAHSNNQLVTITDNNTFTFTAPSNPCHLTLRMVQDAGGTNTVTFPSTVKWGDSGEPTWNTASGKENYIFMYWNGTDYISSGVTGI